jgi:hypothetical protein
MFCFVLNKMSHMPINIHEKKHVLLIREDLHIQVVFISTKIIHTMKSSKGLFEVLGEVLGEKEK